jgi:hypothetical protein
MGTSVQRSGVDGGDERRAGEKNSARRGGRRVEAEWKREREREGALGAVWSSAVVCDRRGSGLAAERAGGALLCDSAGRPGRVGGPVISGWVRRGEAVGAVLTGGVGSTTRPIRISNRIKLISNGFKFAPNFD